MEIQIISLRLLLISILIAFVLISFKTFSYLSKDSLKITACNEQDQLNIYIRYKGNDILINPTSLKNITYCLGKSMPFYDRTIEYIINPGSSFEKDIKDRYKIVHSQKNESISLGNNKLNLSSKKLEINTFNKTILIYKRQVNLLRDLYSKGPARELLVIRPRSSDGIEDLLVKSGLESLIPENGESVEYSY